MADLQSIVYVSTAVREMSEPELESLLAECRVLNLASNVTGTLLYSGGGFMQCFEGARADVQLTYERIRSSRKHHGIIELADEHIGSRSFPDFQMGFVHAARSEALRLSTAIWQRRVDTQERVVVGSSGIDLLKAFWNQMAPRF